MWVVFRDDSRGRMFWRGGLNQDWTSEATAAACWHDRRDAHMTAEALRCSTHAQCTFGEEFIANMPRGDATQYIPQARDEAKESRWLKAGDLTDEQWLNDVGTVAIGGGRPGCEAPGCVLPRGHRCAHMTKRVAAERGVG